MKNLLITISLLFCIAGTKAQIMLEHTYGMGNAATSGNILRINHFSSLGYKYTCYAQTSVNGGYIYIYNLNHSLYKTITIPAQPSIYLMQVWYISDSLFNTNPADIEYLLSYEDTANGYHVRIYNDVGNTLFSKDTVDMGWELPTFPYSEPIFYTPTGYKMILFALGSFSDTASYVYSLPGALPCSECSNGNLINAVSPVSQGNNGSLMNAYPNPAKNSTTIKYELPYGVNQGGIIFYDLKGREVKTFTVDRTFNSLLVSTADLAAGTYLYVLRAGGIYVGSKKMVIIK